MAETSRFGLNKFSPSLGGSITDDGGKFSSLDRDIIDYVLQAFELHDHSGGSNPQRLADPQAAPTALVQNTGGQIGFDGNRYYKVGFVDKYGLETAASPELTVTLPGAIEVTDFPVVTGAYDDNSTLPEDTYFYALTGVMADGETTLGPETVVTIQPGQNQADIELPPLPDSIISWNVWRQNVADDGWTKVFAGQDGQITVSDIGYASGDCLCDPNTQPPTAYDSSSGSKSVVITAPAIPSDAVSWRLYVTTTSGAYDDESLIATIVPVTLGGALPTQYTDIGAALLPGQPLRKSTTLIPSKSVSGGGGGGSGGGGADSHLVTNARPMVMGSSAVASLLRFGTDGGGLNDRVGYDVEPVYNIPDSTDVGDQFEIMTDAVYTLSALVAVQGTATAGTVFKVQFSIRPALNVGDWAPELVHGGQLIVPPGENFVVGSVSTPALFLKAGTLVTATLVPYFTGSAPTDVEMTFGVTMASGSPANNTVYTAPTIASTTSDSDSITINWTRRPADTTAYMLLLYKDGVRVNNTVQPPGSGAASYTFSGLPNDGSQYVVVLMGMKAAGAATLFSVPALGTPGGGGLGAPQNVQATSDDTSVTVTWDAASGPVDHYRALLTDSGLSIDFQTVGTADPYTATFTGLTSDHPYGVYVKSVDADDNEVDSATVNISTTGGSGGGGSTGAFTDNFNRSDGSALGAPNWTQGAAPGSLEVSGNKIINQGGMFGPRFATHDFGVVDKDVQLTHSAIAGKQLIIWLAAVDSEGGSPSLSLNTDGSTSAPGVTFNDGSGNQNGSMSAAPGSNWADYTGSSAVLLAKLAGTTVELWKDGTLCWTYTAPGTLTGATRAGFGLFASGGSVDDFSVAAATATPGGGGGGGGFSDDFNRADANPDSGIFTPEGSAVFKVENNTLKAVSNSNSPNYAAPHAWVDCGDADGTITSYPSAGGLPPGILARFEDNYNFILWLANGYVYQCQAGDYKVVLGSGSAPFAAGDEIQMILNGGTITLKVNGTALFTNIALYSGAPNSTKHGVNFQGTGTDAIDSWSFTP